MLGWGQRHSRDRDGMKMTSVPPNHGLGPREWQEVGTGAGSGRMINAVLNDTLPPSGPAPAATECHRGCHVCVTCATCWHSPGTSRSVPSRCPSTTGAWSRWHRVGAGTAVGGDTGGGCASTGGSWRRFPRRLPRPRLPARPPGPGCQGGEVELGAAARTGLAGPEEVFGLSRRRHARLPAPHGAGTARPGKA